eukprot:5978841-Prymnesium_polylepis.1
MAARLAVPAEPPPTAHDGTSGTRATAPSASGAACVGCAHGGPRDTVARTAPGPSLAPRTAPAIGGALGAAR